MARRLAIGLVLCLICASAASAQIADFTYQGKLVDNTLPANGSYDFDFKLYDALSGGSLLGTRARLGVSVTDGIFTVQLDFPSSLFDGTDRFLEIGVRPAGSPDPHTILLPRQPMTSSPYSIRSLNANNATNATNATNTAQLGGVAASQYVLTTDPRMTNARNPLPNSASYVQNTTSQQSPADFNISGNGTAGGTLSANVLNATTGIDLDGLRVLSTGPGAGNLFVGLIAGESNTTGNNNSFFGESAGNMNTTGGSNSFFGTGAGSANTTASNNAFFGGGAGRLNTTGALNSFFGGSAGDANTTGGSNSFIGYAAGSSNTSGNNNAFFGRQAGDLNTTGSNNSFFGFSANSNTTGDNNSFFGHQTGGSNTTGSNNTAIGASATIGGSNLSFAAAIGAGASVSTSNTVVLGRSLDDVRVPGNLIVVTLGAAGSTDVCRNASNELSTCSSSLRYKTDIKAFRDGLNVVNRLRPISFNWKDGRMKDVGFGAEEVEKVEPLLVTYNQRGEIEGVKYGQLTTVLVNAIREQQTQIDAQQQQVQKLKLQIEQQQEQVRQQQQALGDLKKLVCRHNRTAADRRRKQ